VREIELAVLKKLGVLIESLYNFQATQRKENNFLPTKRQNGLSFKISGLFKCSTKHCNSRMHNGMKNWREHEGILTAFPCMSTKVFSSARRKSGSWPFPRIKSKSCKSVKIADQTSLPMSKQSLFSKINWIHKKDYPQQTSSGSQIIHQAIQLVTTETLRVISRNLCQITKTVGLTLRAKGGITVTHYCIKAEHPKQSTCNPCWFSKFLCVTLGQESEQILTLLIGKATGKNITRSTRTTGAIDAPTANPNLEQIAWGAI
jgi:hypothetical protein